MKLKDIAEYVTDKISSDAIDLDCYVTTDSLLQNKAGRVVAVNLPPQVCTLTHFRKGYLFIRDKYSQLIEEFNIRLDNIASFKNVGLTDMTKAIPFDCPTSND